MTRKRVYTIVFVGLTLGLLVATAWLSRIQPAYAQPPRPEGQALVPAAVGTAFTYQGRLMEGGNAVDETTCRFMFTLWDAETGGNDLDTVTRVTTVRNGYFTVELDFGQNVFTGDPRWMSVRVRCPEGYGSWVDLQGRIPIRPAPYAMFAALAGSLQPGSVVKDSTGNKVVLYAQSGPDWNLPLLVALKTGGVWGDSRFEDGVIGTSQQGNGLYGYSESGKALYADGDAHVEGNLTWKAKTSYITLTAAAFQPTQSTFTYENIGYYLRNYGTEAQGWVASVQLPHGARIKEFAACWKDGSSDAASASLVRRALGSVTTSVLDPADTMATVGSRGGKNGVIAGCATENNVRFPKVDNEEYGYYVYLNLPPNNLGNEMEFYGVQITYEVETPY